MNTISERTAYRWLAAVTTLSAAGTLFLPGLLHGPAAMNGSARGTALVLLVVGVPLLLVAAARRSPEPGERVMIVGLVVYVTFRFGRTSRGLAVFVATVTVANALLWLSRVVPALFDARHPEFLEGSGLTTNPIFVQDLAIWLPLTTLAAVLLWREHAWGVVLSGAALTMWSAESLSVAADQWFGAHADPGSTVVSSSLVVPFVVLAVVCVTALSVLLRRFTPSPTALTDGHKASGIAAADR